MTLDEIAAQLQTLADEVRRLKGGDDEPIGGICSWRAVAEAAKISEDTLSRLRTGRDDVPVQLSASGRPWFRDASAARAYVATLRAPKTEPDDEPAGPIRRTGRARRDKV